MKEESREMKILYAVFLSVMTIRGLISLYDRFSGIGKT
jgi:hypothetical protein